MMADMQEEIEREISYRITDEDIERSQLLVGVDSAQGGREFYKVLTPDAIRNFARGYGDDNPLFVDEDYGADHPLGQPDRAADDRDRHRDRRSTATASPRRSAKGTRGVFAGIHVFVSGQSTEWYRPL